MDVRTHPPARSFRCLGLMSSEYCLEIRQRNQAEKIYAAEA